MGDLHSGKVFGLGVLRFFSPSLLGFGDRDLEGCFLRTTSASCASDSIIPSIQCLGKGEGGFGLESCLDVSDLGRLDS